MSSFQEQESFGAQAVPRLFSEAVMTKEGRDRGLGLVFTSAED